MNAINLSAILEKLLEGKDLSETQMQYLMHEFMTGQASDSQMAAILTALRIKGETATEISTAAMVMRQLSTGVDLLDKQYLVDTCGTGGDGARTFNISTAAAFVVAAAGGRVAKHGNRSVSSSSGSADLLEIAGVNLNITSEQVVSCVQKLGIGFMFAPLHHSAMKHVIGVRKSLGVHTMFNLLGPLSNPANTPYQVIGVYDKKLLPLFAKVLKELGSKHVIVVHAQDGLDEISISSLTDVAELKDNDISFWQIKPQDFNMHYSDLSDITVKTPQDSLDMIQAVFQNNYAVQAAKDIITLNAAAAIYVSGLEKSFTAGVAKAQQVINTGQAQDKLQQFIKFTQGFKV